MILNFNIYQVKEKDTLFSISKKYHTTVYKIMDYNILTNYNIYNGQILIIPIN